MSAEHIPALDSAFELTPAQIQQYAETGWLVIRNLCSTEEVEIYRDHIVRSAMAHNRETRPMEERDTYGKAFLQIMNLWTVDDAVRQFVMARRFANVAAQLLQSEAVRLYHDQALFKEPGGGHTPWHQDQFYWPLGNANTVTMWMPLVDISAEMGSMTFAEGSHKGGFVPISNEISDQSEAFFDQYVAEKGFPLQTAGAMQAGDATFHSGWTLHRAPGNVTSTVREVMTIIYYPDGTVVSEPLNDFQRADHRTWLDSIPSGQPANGPLNPVLK